MDVENVGVTDVFRIPLPAFPSVASGGAITKPSHPGVEEQRLAAAGGVVWEGQGRTSGTSLCIPDRRSVPADRV